MSGSEYICWILLALGLALSQLRINKWMDQVNKKLNSIGKKHDNIIRDIEDDGWMYK